jgi:hypothetical protein
LRRLRFLGVADPLHAIDRRWVHSFAWKLRCELGLLRVDGDARERVIPGVAENILRRAEDLICAARHAAVSADRHVDLVLDRVGATECEPKPDAAVASALGGGPESSTPKKPPAGHSLRARLATSARADEGTVQKQLGRTSPEMTPATGATASV